MARLEKHQAELSQALCDRDQLISIVAHELRTPLSSLQLALQAMLRLMRHPSTQPSAERIKEAIDVAERQGKRLAHEIDAFLEASHLMSGRLGLALEEVDLVEIARVSAAGMRAQLDSAGCEMVLRGADSIVGRWDRARLLQLCNHLLKNAIVRGRGAPVTIDVLGAAASATLAVTDQGTEISAADRACLFMPFRGNDSAPVPVGFLPDLFVARRIAEAHGGKVALAGSPTGGATFAVQLPKLTAAGAER
jgi:signal transduction histidine kinase